MKTPLNPLMFGSYVNELLITQPGIITKKLRPGKYTFILRGGGGAGGGAGVSGWTAGGAGGAGAPGEIVAQTITLTQTTTVTICVGAGGLTYANGGNGGAGGVLAYGSAAGGGGGGGGHASYIMFDAETASQSYFGWKFPPASTGVYRGQTKRYYVTYNDPQTLYISDTPMAYTWGNGFELVNGNTYVNGQQLFYASDSATVTVNISIVNGVVRLVGTASNAFGATVVPTDVSADFVGGMVYTQTDSPAAGDNVYDDAFNVIGTITSVDGATFEYNQNTYSRYSDIDTTQQGSVFSNVYFANGGGGGGGGGGGRSYGRYGGGGSGGGGGGYYHFVNGAETSYAGAQGGRTNSFPSGGGGGGIGHNDVFTSNAIFSGAGSSGSDWSQGGGSGNIYCGAGGGGGGPGNNHHNAWGGGGGGGAGGSPNAGGGAGGSPVSGASTSPASYYSRNAYNHYTTPTAVVDYTGQTVTSGWGIGGNGQTGSQVATNGAAGWLYMVRIKTITRENYGFITDTASDSEDYGFINDAVSETKDYGFIKE